MSDTIKLETLRLRRRELAESVAHETEQAEARIREAEEHKANASRSAIRLEETDYLLERMGCGDVEDDNVIHMRRSLSGSKPERRFQNEGPTSDIAKGLYDQPGVERDTLLAALAKKYPGSDAGSIRRMINRMIREGYARREEGDRLYLTALGTAAWERSPLRWPNASCRRR